MHSPPSAIRCLFPKKQRCCSQLCDRSQPQGRPRLQSLRPPVGQQQLQKLFKPTQKTRSKLVLKATDGPASHHSALAYTQSTDPLPKGSAQFRTARRPHTRAAFFRRAARAPYRQVRCSRWLGLTGGCRGEPGGEHISGGASVEGSAGQARTA